MRFHDDNIPREVREFAEKCIGELKEPMTLLSIMRDTVVEEAEKEAVEVIYKKYGIACDTHRLLSDRIVSSTMDKGEISAEYDNVNDEWIVSRGEKDPIRKEKYLLFLDEMTNLQESVIELIIEEAEKVPGFAYGGVCRGLFCACIEMYYHGESISGPVVIPTAKSSGIVFFGSLI
jgi:hypothetical protein